MKSHDVESRLSILELPSIVKLLFQRAQRPLLPEATGPVDLFVRYLRRKPGRGLAVIYHVDEAGRRGGQGPRNAPDRSVSLTLDEMALAGAHIRFDADQVQQAQMQRLSSGVLALSELGLSVQAFPADAGLPALAASCDTRHDSTLFRALESAAQRQFDDPAWQLLSARAEPVRYKPGNRCVIRYHLTLRRAEGIAAQSRNLVLFGKVYASAEQARNISALQQHLYAEQAQDGVGVPTLPRTLGLVESLGLTLHEAVLSASAGEDGAVDVGRPLPTGTQVMQPQIVRGRGGEVSEVMIPEAALRATARALARLHQSAASPGAQALRAGAKEAKRAKERAALIASYYPALAEEVLGLGRALATCLEGLEPDAYRPAHGGFKPSQLLIDQQQVFIVDFDGFCLADPALDVGYFLAYLRPSGLWHHRPGMRQWFDAAAAVFLQAYEQAMLVGGVDASTIPAIKERSVCYEAALLFKIATRRVNRLNSPRQAEVSAMLSEIAACMARN